MIPATDPATAQVWQHSGSSHAVERGLSLQALQMQRERGVGSLYFQSGLETAFRRYLVESGRSARLGLILICLFLHLITPLYYVRLLQVPAAFVGQAYILQYGLQFSGVAAAGVMVWFRPFSRYTQGLCAAAFLAMIAGLLAQRTIGAVYGFEVPPEFAAITIAGLLILARIPFWSVLPWALLAVAAIVLNEWLFMPASAAGAYHMVACLMLFAVALAGGYAIEYSIRWSWLNNGLLTYMSRQDGLTGLLNRKALEAAVEQGVHHARRERCAFAIAMIDIDYFKAYNDAYGHRNGDTVICRVADKLHAAARRPRDICGRYGGEEFGLLWVDGAYAELCALAEQLRSDIEQAHIEHRASGLSDRVTVSIGLYWVDAEQTARVTQTFDSVPGALAAHLLDDADTLLYRAKAEGRNRVVCARASL